VTLIRSEGAPPASRQIRVSCSQLARWVSRRGLIYPAGTFAHALHIPHKLCTVTASVGGQSL